MTKNALHSHCHCCGTRYASPDWPRTCGSCGHTAYANPLPIGVLLQTVTDGDRTGILTPTRGIQPQRGYMALVGGHQEIPDEGSEGAALREMFEEIGMNLEADARLNPLCTRSTGPLMPGMRQNLVFIVNENPVHISAFDGFEPNEETLEIHVSWAPQRLAFPSHTYALAQYFETYHGLREERYLIQPRIGALADNGETITNVIYHQPLLDCSSVWMVETEIGTSTWRAAQ